MKELFSAYWAFTKSLENGVKDLGLNYGNPKVILYLTKNVGCQQIDVARDCYLEPATLSVVLSKMEQNGLIERKRLEEDKRSYAIYPTEKGSHIFQKVEDKLNYTIDMAFSGFSEEDKDQLRAYLDKITTNLKSKATDPSKVI